MKKTKDTFGQTFAEKAFSSDKNFFLQISFFYEILFSAKFSLGTFYLREN